MKRIGLTASEEKSFENVDDGRTTDTYIYYKLTEGSGELKNDIIIAMLAKSIFFSFFALLQHCFKAPLSKL